MNKYKGRVTRVIDGDTFDALVCLGFGVEQVFRVRIQGIDAPEIRGEERDLGRFIKNYLDNLIGGKTVYLYEAPTKDKYGRALARVETEDGIDISNLLVEEGLAERYLSILRVVIK